MKFTLVAFLLFLKCPIYAGELTFNHLDWVENKPSAIIKNLQKDSAGFIWVTTEEDISRFDGYELKSIRQLHRFPDPFDQVSMFSAVLTDSSDNFWVGTKDRGVFAVIGDQYHHFGVSENPSHRVNSDLIYAVVEGSDGQIWVTTDQGLNRISVVDSVPKTTAFDFPYNNNRMIKKVIPHDNDQLLVASKTALLSFDLATEKFSLLSPSGSLSDAYIWDIHLDAEGVLWLTNDDGLYAKNPNSPDWIRVLPEALSTYVLKSITSDQNNIWLGTATQGLIRLSKSSHQIQTHRMKVSDNRSLPSDDITIVFHDSSGLLWLGGFGGDISYSNLTSVNMGLNSIGSENNSCFSSPTTYHFNQDHQGNLLITTQNEVVRIMDNGSACQSIKIGTHSDLHPINTFVTEDNQLWVSSNKGLHQVDQYSFTESKHFLLEDQIILFLTNDSSDNLLIGTSSGLLIFDPNKPEYKTIDSAHSELNHARFNDFTKTQDNKVLLATDRGVALLHNNQLSLLESVQKQLTTKKIEAIEHDQKNTLWIGTEGSGLIKVNLSNNQITPINHANMLPPKAIIRSLLIDQNGHLWINVSEGLIRFQPEQGDMHFFNANDGLQSGAFTARANYRSNDGLLYWGGRKGFNAFDPNSIEVPTKAPAIKLTSLQRFSTPVIPGETYGDFKINQPISKLAELTLTHKDYVIGFKFSALDFIDPKRNLYAYMLEGFDPDWNHTDANNRHATYTNLPRGNYTFRVKAANKDGVWNEEGVLLKIKVLPAPWLSWWAITLYVLAVLVLAFWLIRRKLQANQILARLLQQEVDEKTKELQLQKQKIESLLAKKNELFSNVSHEFRTPLTLILGPIQELIEDSQSHKSRQSLTVLKRNANRLLSLVEQLLQLAKVSDFKKAKLSEQEASQQISAIVESFQHLAKDKKIKLKLPTNDQAFIKATDQCLDATLGNLISNAIKYSNAGGDVVVTSAVHQNQLVIRVKDEGAGLTAQQQLDVFKRFKRLDAHQNIEGIGIGLAVAKELAEVNQGTIEVDSEIGTGSQFTIFLPVIENPHNLSGSGHQTGTLIEQLTRAEESVPETTYNNELVNNKNIVLVIEDNHDMRNHIVGVLQSEYHCLQAKNGKEGVANAIKFIPDLIICDVMMPEMDGFKVSRVIRSDQRTSHIPLILLTALNDRENRIKGWREHVDVYMTKPFDREELCIQVENIITIRNILKKKARIRISKNKIPHHSDLPKKDYEFVEKLIHAIKNNYQNPQLNRDKLASMMAVSDRQLQRKIKALIDQNPMDMLREYRLKQAAVMLKDGYQVGQTSDDVGFKTPTHFSQCFKAQYGLTPKQYQQQFK